MRKLGLCLLIMAVFLLSACSGSESTPAQRAAQALGVVLPDGEVLEHTDTHGGFHGDGCTYTVLVFQEDISASLSGEFWHPLPLSENMTHALYGTESYNSHMLSNGFSLPEITNGLYYFRDRYSNAADPADDTALFSRHAFNYTAAVYDADTKTLYVFKMDT